MHSDKRNLLPLRQSLHPGAEAKHLFATPGVVDWLSKPEKFLITVEGDAGTIHAASESALREARELLRQVHGGRITLGETSVHTFVDARGERVEPVMFTRVSAGRDHAVPLLEILKDRGADVQEVELQWDRSVIRAEAPLARLIGSEEAVQELTAGQARFLSWLARYAPVSTPAEGARAGWHR